VLDVAECAPHAAGGPACQLAHASLVLLPCHSDDPHPGHRDAASPPLDRRSVHTPTPSYGPTAAVIMRSATQDLSEETIREFKEAFALFVRSWVVGRGRSL